MDYKSKLNELVANEKSEAETKKAQREAFSESKHQAFAPMATALREISEAVEPNVASFSIGPYSAKMQIGTTRYEVEPNESSFSLHKPTRLEPGFKISTLTTFQYAEVDSFERDYVLKSVEVVVDEVMKLLAKVLASKPKKLPPQ
jgi:hypothetical protein